MRNDLIDDHAREKHLKLGSSSASTNHDRKWDDLQHNIRMGAIKRGKRGKRGTGELDLHDRHATPLIAAHA